jgi:hypothetical protein
VDLVPFVDLNEGRVVKIEMFDAPAEVPMVGGPSSCRPASAASYRCVWHGEGGGGG